LSVWWVTGQCHGAEKVLDKVSLDIFSKHLGLIALYLHMGLFSLFFRRLFLKKMSRHKMTIVIKFRSSSIRSPSLTLGFFCSCHSCNKTPIEINKNKNKNGGNKGTIEDATASSRTYKNTVTPVYVCLFF
jgi:hypothetical protein